MSTTTTVSPRALPLPLLGLLAGLAVGLSDYTTLQLIGVQMLYQGADLSIPVMAVFSATFAALGYVIGKLTDARGKAKRDAETIARQLAQLEQTQKQMLQIEKLASIGRLAAGVAHEVRNPLGVIRSSAALLVESLDESDDDNRKAGRFIQEEIDRLDGFVHSLLDFSRPIEATVRDETLHDILARVQRLCGHQLEQAGATLELDTTEAPERWCVDAELLTRALVGMVTNSCHAVERGGRIRIAVRDDGDVLRLSVADDGRGVPEELRERLFEPFVTSKAKGTGLGLSMAARIVEAHGGELSLFDSGGLGERGRGACFQLRIPRGSLGEERAA
jgi:two-component system sensor histidine kinase HydH